MTEKKNGNDSLEERLNRFLDDFNKRIALNEKQTPLNDIHHFININLEEIKTADSSYCFEIAVALTQYAFFLQRVINRERAFIEAASSRMNIMFAKEWANYQDKSVWKSEEIIKKQIINGDKFLLRLSALIDKSKSIVQETFGLVQIIQKAADQWRDMGKAKSYGNR